MDKQTKKNTTRKSAPKRAVRARGKELTDNSLHIHEALMGEREDPMSRTESISIAAGVVLLAIAAFTLLCLVSHLITGGEDQKVLQNHLFHDAHNWAGYVGAWWSDYWITRGFGFGAFFLPVFLFAASLKLTGAYHVRLWKWFINCTFLLCWVSVASAFFFTSTFAGNPAISYISPGGFHGLRIVQLLEQYIGSVGAFIVIILVLLAYLCYLSAETIRIIKRLLHPQQLAREPSSAASSLSSSNSCRKRRRFRKARKIRIARKLRKLRNARKRRKRRNHRTSSISRFPQQKRRRRRKRPMQRPIPMTTRPPSLPTMTFPLPPSLRLPTTLHSP